MYKGSWRPHSGHLVCSSFCLWATQLRCRLHASLNLAANCINACLTKPLAKLLCRLLPQPVRLRAILFRQGLPRRSRWPLDGRPLPQADAGAPSKSPTSGCEVECCEPFQRFEKLTHKVMSNKQSERNQNDEDERVVAGLGVE